RAGAEVGERHPVAAAHPRVALVDRAGKAVRWEPFGHRVGVEEGAIDALGRGAEHAVQADGVRGIGHSGISPAKRVGWSSPFWLSSFGRTAHARLDMGHTLSAGAPGGGGGV